MTEQEMSRWCDRTLLLTPFSFCLVVSREAYYEECHRAGIKPEDQGVPWHEGSNATVSHFYKNQTTLGRAFSIVAVNPEANATRSGIEIAGTLCHEAVHLFQEVCCIYCEDKPSAELQAYAIQAIAQELMEQYHRQVIAPTERRA